MDGNEEVYKWETSRAIYYSCVKTTDDTATPGALKWLKSWCWTLDVLKQSKLRTSLQFDIKSHIGNECHNTKNVVLGNRILLYLLYQKIAFKIYWNDILKK